MKIQLDAGLQSVLNVLVRGPFCQKEPEVVQKWNTRTTPSQPSGCVIANGSSAICKNGTKRCQIIHMPSNRFAKAASEEIGKLKRSNSMIKFEDAVEQNITRHATEASYGHTLVNDNKLDELMENKERLKELIHHAYIHSHYPECGFKQMTTPQKALLYPFLMNEGMCYDTTHRH